MFGTSETFVKPGIKSRPKLGIKGNLKIIMVLIYPALPLLNLAANISDTHKILL